jgi:hypothetical protein|tara:strand:+ start:274 stop:516 length:243 start_codon:yes stop_codon:yes gene_type:complete
MDKPTKRDIENAFVEMLEKYPKSLKKTISTCFTMILQCFIIIYGEKKTIKLLDNAKQSVKSGKYTQKARKPRKTRKKTEK